MKKVCKLITLLLALAMLCGAFAACTVGENGSDGEESQSSSNGASESSTDASDVTESETLPSAIEQSGLEIKDMGGKEFNIWNSVGGDVWSPKPMDITAEDDLTDIINKAGYDRNQKLIKELNVKLHYENSNTNPSNQSAQNYDKNALNTLWQAGIEKYDIVFTGTYPSSSLAVEGFYYDLSQSDYIHPDAYYYESQVNEQIKFYDRQFFAMGYYSVTNTMALEATFVNTKVLDDITKGTVTINDLYDKALNNQWTLEEMLELGNKYTINSNTGVWETDQYSAIVSNNGAHSLDYWLGGTVIEWNEASSRYNCTLSSAVNQNLLEYIRTLVTNDTRFGLVKNDEHIDAFVGRASPFLVTPMDAIQDIMNTSGLEWAILPPPCYEEGDDYRSFSTGWNMNFAGVPSACLDIDKATYLYEMFMCFSYDYVYPAYYEKCFKTQYQPDALSAKVFDVIAKSRFVDLDNVYQLGASSRIKGLIQSGTASIPNTVETTSASVSQKLVTLKTTFEESIA